MVDGNRQLPGRTSTARGVIAAAIAEELVRSRRERAAASPRINRGLRSKGVGGDPGEPHPRGAARKLYRARRRGAIDRGLVVCNLDRR